MVQGVRWIGKVAVRAAFPDAREGERTLQKKAGFDEWLNRRSSLLRRFCRVCSTDG